MNIIIWDYESVWCDVWPKSNCMSLWPIFHGPVILHYILQTICYILRNYGSVWPDIWPQNKCRSLWPIFHGPVILPYIFKTIWCKNIIIWLSLVTLTCGSWSECKHDLYFTVQWFCLISWRLFDVCTSYFGIINQYDPRFDLKIKIGHCDLYFLVQWFFLVSGRLFDVWTSLFGIMVQYDLTFDLKCMSLWPIFHGQVIVPYIFKTIWCMNIILWDYGSVWPKVWPQNKYLSLLSIFHGPLFLPYILKTIWCKNIIIWDNESVWLDIWPQNKYRSLWTIFHGPVIFPYILKTIWCMNIILCDLYFMGRWFCLISPRLFDAWVSYFQIMRQCDPDFDLKIYIFQHDLYFMV